MKMRVWVATLAARYAGNVGLCDRRKTYGSQKALIEATHAVFIVAKNALPFGIGK